MWPPPLILLLLLPSCTALLFPRPLLRPSAALRLPAKMVTELPVPEPEPGPEFDKAEPALVAEDPRAIRRTWRRGMRNDVLSFAGPALSTVLADPLMSVVDALCCGRFCSTLQLASLGPALAVFNFANYFFYFLSASTTVLTTRALACQDNVSAENTISTAVQLAAACGVALTTTLLLFAAPLVSATGCIAELVPIASRYLRVRAIGQPVVLMSMVVQAGLLAQGDVHTPMQVVGVACALNVVGDLLLVPRVGAVGAAWATLGSQLVALPLLLALSVARRRLRVRPRRPRLPELSTFFGTAAPLLVFEIGMNTCYTLVQSLSTQFSVAAAAAFQALWTPVAVLTFATYPLKQAAQVFLPRLLYADEQSIGGTPKSKEFLRVLATLSSGCGLILAVLGVALAHSPALLTADAALWPIIRSFAPYVAAGMLVLGFAQVLEGVLLGTGDLAFLSWSQLANIGCAAIVAFLTKALGLGVQGTWLVFLTFVVARVAQAATRVFVSRRPWLVDDLTCDNA